MDLDKKQLQREIDSISPSIVHELERDLSDHFDKCGLFYRMFSRQKSSFSTIDKLIRKGAEYQKQNKKMQDLLGVRLALYFKDDIDLCVKIIQNNYSIIEIVRDEEESDVFKPMRLNIVCDLPDKISLLFNQSLWDFPIDKTFEIQIRTVFSEGWHEIEHDLRYKHKSDWKTHMDLSRNLNGIFATLETCDWAILNVLDQLAYYKYQSRDWEPMLRTHLRIRINNENLSKDIIDIFNENHNVAKSFFKFDRKRLLEHLSRREI